MPVELSGSSEDIESLFVVNVRAFFPRLRLHEVEANMKVLQSGRSSASIDGTMSGLRQDFSVTASMLNLILNESRSLADMLCPGMERMMISAEVLHQRLCDVEMHLLDIMALSKRC